MGSIKDKLNKLETNKNNIKQALTNKGLSPTDKMADYPELIKGIEALTQNSKNYIDAIINSSNVGYEQKLLNIQNTLNNNITNLKSYVNPSYSLTGKKVDQLNGLISELNSQLTSIKTAIQNKGGSVSSNNLPSIKTAISNLQTGSNSITSAAKTALRKISTDSIPTTTDNITTWANTALSDLQDAYDEAYYAVNGRYIGDYGNIPTPVDSALYDICRECRNLTGGTANAETRIVTTSTKSPTFSLNYTLYRKYNYVGLCVIDYTTNFYEDTIFCGSTKTNQLFSWNDGIPGSRHSDAIITESTQNRTAVLAGSGYNFAKGTWLVVYFD